MEILDFIRDHKLVISKRDFDGLYEAALWELVLGATKLTEFLVECGINPLEYLTKLIPGTISAELVEKFCKLNCLIVPKNIKILDANCGIEGSFPSILDYDVSIEGDCLIREGSINLNFSGETTTVSLSEGCILANNAILVGSRANHITLRLYHSNISRPELPWYRWAEILCADRIQDTVEIITIEFLD